MYPVPFNKLVSDINYRYENYSKVLPSLPYVLTGDIPRFENQTSDILMQTFALFSMWAEFLKSNKEIVSFKYLSPKGVILYVLESFPPSDIKEEYSTHPKFSNLLRAGLIAPKEGHENIKNISPINF